MIDIFIIVLLVWAGYSGWRAGFLKEVISTVGFLIGLLVATACYSAFGKYLAVDGSDTNVVTSVIAFLLLWVIVPIFLGLVANILTRALKGMQLGIPNSILGALVSLIKYFVLLSCVLNVMDGLHILNKDQTEGSYLYAPVTGALQLFFPGDTTAVTPGEGQAREDTLWVDMDSLGKAQDSRGTEDKYERYRRLKEIRLHRMELPR